MYQKEPIQVAYSPGFNGRSEHYKLFFGDGLLSFEEGLHHLVETLWQFYEDDSLRVESIEVRQLTLSYNETPSLRARIIYRGSDLRYLTMVALWFIADTGAASDKAKRFAKQVALERATMTPRGPRIR